MKKWVLYELILIVVLVLGGIIIYNNMNPKESIDVCSEVKGIVIGEKSINKAKKEFYKKAEDEGGECKLREVKSYINVNGKNYISRLKDKFYLFEVSDWDKDRGELGDWDGYIIINKKTLEIYRLYVNGIAVKYGDNNAKGVSIEAIINDTNEKGNNFIINSNTPRNALLHQEKSIIDNDVEEFFKSIDPDEIEEYIHEHEITKEQFNILLEKQFNKFNNFYKKNNVKLSDFIVEELEDYDKKSKGYIMVKSVNESLLKNKRITQDEVKVHRGYKGKWFVTFDQ